MNRKQQQQIEIQDSHELSQEGKQVVEIFSEMQKKQLDFLDVAGKSMIERIAAFLAILFAVTAFGNNFPPTYLKGNMPAKVMVVVTLALYLFAMAASILAIQPRFYEIPIYNVTNMKDKLRVITKYKMRCVQIAGICFALGSIALATLIIFIIWIV